MKTKPRKWTKTMRSRFAHLAVLESLGTATPEELHELNELSAKRSKVITQTELDMRKSDDLRRRVGVLLDRIGIDRV